MLRVSILSLILGMALAMSAAADHQHAEAETAGAAPSPDTRSLAPLRLLIEVRGLVCSFCAYGVEKALGKIEGLDAAEFGDGVFVDIDQQQVVLALVPNAPLPLAEIHAGVVKAGYDPVRFHLRIAGTSRAAGESLVVEGTSPARRFELSAAPDTLEDGADVDLLVHLEAEVAKTLAPDAPIPVSFDARF